MLAATKDKDLIKHCLIKAKVDKEMDLGLRERRMPSLTLEEIKLEE